MKSGVVEMDGLTKVLRGNLLEDSLEKVKASNSFSKGCEVSILVDSMRRNKTHRSSVSVAIQIYVSPSVEDQDAGVQQNKDSKQREDRERIIIKREEEKRIRGMRNEQRRGRRKVHT